MQISAEIHACELAEKAIRNVHPDHVKNAVYGGPVPFYTRIYGDVMFAFLDVSTNMLAFLASWGCVKASRVFSMCDVCVGSR